MAIDSRISPVTRPALVLACLAILGLANQARADDEIPLGFSLDPPSERVYGGTAVGTCNWPTTVALLGSTNCTGTLVHPRLVIYAAHCGQYSSVEFGESAYGAAKTVYTERCATRPGGGSGYGLDHAYCILSEELTDVPIVPMLMGCETEVLQPGKEVTIVGFGVTEYDGYGGKQEVTTTINSITSDNEAFIGGSGKDSCNGDSGGPVYVELTSAEGFDDTWRVFGITSYGGACGTGGYYSMMHHGVEWIESDSGIDITPCHDADGTWNPGPDCFQFPKDPGAAGGAWSSWCDPGPLGGYSNACGPGFNSEPDDAPPSATITSPADGSRHDSDPGTGLAPVTISVAADDGDGWGIAVVKLVVHGVTQDASADPTAPYEFAAQFPPGVYEVSAVATDYADNEGFADPIIIGVDEDPPSQGDGAGDGSDGGDDGGGDGADDGGDDGGGDGGNDGGGGADWTDDDSRDEGCGCTATPAPTYGLGLLLVGLARGRRRRARTGAN
jgi:MYXO-CTERM domain-containing protein